MKEITYKQVLNNNGEFIGLELWQDGQHITVSFGAKGTHRNGYRWIEVKEIVDKLANKVHKESLESSNNGFIKQWEEAIGKK